MNQKFVLKNDGSNCSEMVDFPSTDSGRMARRSMVRMCPSLKPNRGAVSRSPSLTRRAFDEVFIVSFQAKVSWVTVWVPSSVGIEAKRSKVQRYLLSSIRPPRRT